MPSNLQEFGTNSSTIISNNESISSIPSYLTKSKQVFNRDIAAWKFNSDASNVDSVILALGSGHVLTSDNVSYSISLYSSFVLGKTGFNNRWDISYQTTENFLVSYFDGNSYFKRLTIDYSTGNAKVRNIDVRNGNNPKCNAYHQIAFGISAEASFEDYSMYRHNLRSSHTGISQLNSENAIDLYLWDLSNDTPDELGSRHVMRWNALGNEELISGFRIDGGVNFVINNDTDKASERTNFAIPGKGVIYYNNYTNTYRFSVNNGLFSDFGSGGGGSVSQPNTQVVYGTGTSVGSASSFTYNGSSISVPSARYGITHATVASMGGTFTLLQTSGYWVMPTGAKQMVIALPSTPIDGTMYCIFMATPSSSPIGGGQVTSISGNGKLIFNSNTSGGTPIGTISPDYATILVYDIGSDIWYAYKAIT